MNILVDFEHNFIKNIQNHIEIYMYAHQFNPPKFNQTVKLIDYFLLHEIMTSIDVSKINYRYLEQISSNNE